MADNVSLLGIVVGGGLTLAGTIVSQALGVFASSKERRHQRNARQLDKLEKIADAVSATLPWFVKLRACNSLEEVGSTVPPDEATKAAGLAAIYFPSLIEPAREYVNGLVRYHWFAVDCVPLEGFNSSTIGFFMTRAVIKDKSLLGREEEPVTLRMALDDAIAKEAERYR